MRLKYFFLVWYLAITFAVCGFLVVPRTSIKAAGIATLNEVKTAEYTKLAVEKPAVGRYKDETPFEPAPLVLNMAERPDIILEAYMDSDLQEGVRAFFGDLIGSREIAEIILRYAAVSNIPPALAFALCYEESRYTVRAFNRNGNGSVDRGLFQLNNASFPDLEVADFYDPATNTRHGLAYLRWCLNMAGSDVAALAMYNAGITRVRSAGTPKSTLNYISRILRRQRGIEELFAERFMAEYAPSTQPTAEPLPEITKTKNEAKPPIFILSFFAPLWR